MSLLNKKHLLTINLEDSSIVYPLNMAFFNTDKNIANLYARIQYQDDIISYLSKQDAANYKIKLTVIKPKTNNIKEVEGVLTTDFSEDYAIYKFALPSEFTDQVGLVACEFIITNGNEILTIKHFSYTINASKVTGLNPEIIPSPDLPVLKQLIEEMKKAQQWITNIDDTKASEVKTYSSKKIEDIKNNVDEQFITIESKKADQSFVDSQFATIVSGAPKATFTTLQELKAKYPTGSEGIFLVLADGHWYYWNSDSSDWLDGGVYQSTQISDKSIKESKVETSFLNRIYDLDKNGKIKVECLFKEKSLNLFNKNTLTMGFYLINGVPTSSSAYASYSDYIKVVPNSDIWCSNILSTDGGAFYDENFNFINKVTRVDSANPNLIHTPSNCYYMRINISTGSVKVDDYMVVLGSTAPLTYLKHKIGEIEGLNIDGRNIVNSIYPEQIFNFLNLFDKDNCENNKYISNLGVISSSDTIDLSRYIRVDEGQVIGCNVKYDQQGCYFNQDFKFIKQITLTETYDGSGWYTEQVPQNAHYIKVNVTHFRKNEYIIKKSSEKPSNYSPYSIDENYFRFLSGHLKGKKILCIGDSITWLDGNTASGYDNGSTVVVGYQEQLRKKGATVTTMGHSGATIRKYVSSDDMEHGSLVDNIKNSSYDVTGYDIITIFAGTNDVGRGLRLGTLGSESDNTFDETTTIGALRAMIEYIRTNNPTCDIYLMTPLRSGLSSRPYEKMEEVAGGITSVGNMYGIKVINLLHESGIGKGNIDTFLYDKLHPNNTGFERIGIKIVNEID